LTEAEYQDLKARVEREFTIRQKLAKLAGLKRPDEATIEELFLRVLIKHEGQSLEEPQAEADVLDDFAHMLKGRVKPETREAFRIVLRVARERVVVAK